MTCNMPKRAVAAFVIGLINECAIAADAFNLVTLGEVAREQEYESRMPAEPLTPKAVPVPGAPLIELQKPQIQDVLKTPFPIQLGFKAGDDAEIAPGSFKVLYGFLKIDITDRVVQHAKVTKDGVSVEKAEIPAGSHKLLLQIRDTKDRKTETTMSFKVE